MTDIVIKKEFIEACYDIVRIAGEAGKYANDRILIEKYTPGWARTYHDPTLRVTVGDEVVLKVETPSSYGYYRDARGFWIEVYRPGKWEAYIKDVLHPQMLALDKMRLEKQKEEERKRLEANFAPINDSDLFPEVGHETE